jgi:hypothetical protein
MTVSYLAQGRFSKPYLVIWHPVQHVGAWYDRRLRLRALDVSADLLEFARVSSRLVHPWNDLSDIELPTWADNAALDDCVCFWLYDDSSSADDLARIPGG